MTIKQDVPWRGHCVPKQKADCQHVYLAYKIFPVREGKKEIPSSESIPRLSSFTAHHSVILFGNNSIKLIVVLGNYPQPPAGQISIHDLNNAY